MRLFVLLLLFSTFSFSQVENDKSMIIKNNVKSSFERHCFLNSNSSCTSFYEEYDKRGNSIEWNMGRIGTFYRSFYDKNDNKVLLQWIDKSDTTKINSFSYAYDKNNTLVKDGDVTFKNTYNSKQQLIKQYSLVKSTKEKSTKKTKTINWTNFDKIESEIILTELLEYSEKKLQKKLTSYRVKYNYDVNNNVSKELHFNNDTIVNTIKYKYDSLNRLIEKREHNPERIKGINNLKFNGRKDITELITKISYNKNGSIKEKYAYYSDSCMSLDNHFLYKYFYKSNGLIDNINVYEDNTHVFSISYEYEYY